MIPVHCALITMFSFIFVLYIIAHLHQFVKSSYLWVQIYVTITKEAFLLTFLWIGIQFGIHTNLYINL